MEQAAASLVAEDALESRGIYENPLGHISEEHRLADLGADRASIYDNDPVHYESSTTHRNRHSNSMSAGSSASSSLNHPTHAFHTNMHAYESHPDSELRKAASPETVRGADEEDDMTVRSTPDTKNYSMSSFASNRIFHRALVNLGFILTWYLFSTIISLYNKWMFSDAHFAFPNPLLVTSSHMFVQWGLSYVLIRYFPQYRTDKRPSRDAYLKSVMPTGITTALDIGFSNLSLQIVTLSFYTMCKSSSLAFVLLFAFIFGLERPTWKLNGIIAIITIGVIMMVFTETQFNLVGMFEVLSASALGGLRWSMTQILLDKQSLGLSNPPQTVFWLAPIMGVTLLIGSLIFENWTALFRNEQFFGSFTGSLQTVALILLPGFIVMCMILAEFGLIKRTSVVTLSVAGIFKEVLVIYVSSILFQDHLNLLNILGLIVTIAGIVAYNVLKYNQAVKNEGTGDSHVFTALPTDEEAAFAAQFELPMRNMSQTRLDGAEEHESPLHQKGHQKSVSFSSSIDSLDPDEYLAMNSLSDRPR